jgi:aldehyde dehydrogenase (NAD+)
MRTIDHIYIDGAFVKPHGNERLELINPSTEKTNAYVVLADKEDALRAVAAAKQALPTFSQTTKAERIAMLKRLHAAVLAQKDALRDATIEEYGGPVSRSTWVSQFAAQSFLDAATVLEGYEFERTAGTSTVVMEPVGVSLLITPWNSNAGSICSKLAMAIAAGCTTVIKPSELSAIQTQIVTEALHEAGLPPGVVNVLSGRGEIVGAALSSHPDVSRISFTGSGGTGKLIARAALETSASRWALAASRPPSFWTMQILQRPFPKRSPRHFRTAARLASRARGCSFHRHALRKSPCRSRRLWSN